MAENKNHTQPIEKISCLTQDLKLQFDLLTNKDKQQAAELISQLQSICLSGALQSLANDKVTESPQNTSNKSPNTKGYDTTPQVCSGEELSKVTPSNPAPDSNNLQHNEVQDQLKPDWLLLQKLEHLKNENKTLKCQLWKNKSQSPSSSSQENTAEAFVAANECLNEVITKAVFLAETQTSPAQLSHYLNVPGPTPRRRGRPPKRKSPLTNGLVPSFSDKSKVNTTREADAEAFIPNQDYENRNECSPLQENHREEFENFSTPNSTEAENLPPRKQKLLAKSRVSRHQESRSPSPEGVTGAGESDLSEPEVPEVPEVPVPASDPPWSGLPLKRKRGRPRKYSIPPAASVRGKHRNIVRHKCQICQATFTHGRPFKRHLSSYPRGGCSCRLCKKEYVSYAIFLHHDCDAQRKTKGAQRICKHCGKKFTNTKKFALHLKQEHNDRTGEPECFCKYCNKGFIKRATMFKHFLEHAEQGQTVCYRCGDMLSDTEEALHNHHQYHLQQANHVCDKCGATFLRRQQYEQHMSAHSKYDCLMCDAYFSTRKALEKHQRVLHGIRTDYDTKKFYCDQCGKCFTRPGLLEIHTRIHTGEKPIECNICHMYFRTPKALNKHRQTYTHMARAGDIQKERDHLCQICGKAYYRKQALQRHMRYHTGEKPYKCPHCEYVCRENNNLKRHIALHFSQRDFVCETCGAAFHAKKTLETHRVYKHSEARSFHCEECPMSFKTPNSLRRHMRIHSNTRPHKCTWCGTGFNRLYNLRRHLRSVHGNDEGIPPPKRVKLLDVPMGLEYHKGSVAAATGLSPPEPTSTTKKKSRRGKCRPVQLYPELKDPVELLTTPALYSTVEEGGGRQDGLAILITPPATRLEPTQPEPALAAVQAQVPGVSLAAVQVQAQGVSLAGVQAQGASLAGVQAPGASTLNPQVINQIVSNTVSLMHGYYQDADGNVRGYTLAPPTLASSTPENTMAQPTIQISERNDFQQDLYSAMPNFLHFMQGNS